MAAAIAIILVVLSIIVGAVSLAANDGDTNDHPVVEQSREALCPDYEGC